MSSMVAHTSLHIWGCTQGSEYGLVSPGHCLVMGRIKSYQVNINKKKTVPKDVTFTVAILVCTMALRVNAPSGFVCPSSHA